MLPLIFLKNIQIIEKSTFVYEFLTNAQDVATEMLCVE